MRKVYLLILGVFCIHSLHAQFSPVWTSTYQNTTTPYFSNESRKVAVDPSGNIFVLADATSDLDPLGAPGGTTYHYTILLKYDTNGNLVEDVLINVRDHYTAGFDTKGAFGLEVDASGNVFIGYTPFDIVSKFDVVISKYSNTLNLLWNYRFNPGSFDDGIDMKLAGGTVSAIVKSTTVADITYHLIRANAAGMTSTPLYSFVTNVDFPSSIEVDASQNIYVTGYSLVSGYKNILAASVNSTGAFRWKNVYNGGTVVRDDYGTELVLGTSGELFVTGTTDTGLPQFDNMIIINYGTSNGKIAWMTNHDNLGAENGIHVKNFDVNYLYVGSVTNNNSIIIDRISKTDGSRNAKAVYSPIPLTAYSGLNDATLADMYVSPDERIYITGDILATDMSAEDFSASYLVKFDVLASNRNNRIKKSMEIPVEGNVLHSHRAVGIAADLTKEDIYWLEDLIEQNDTHESEIINLHDFDVPSPIRLQNSAMDFQVNIFPNPSRDNVILLSDKTISKIEIFGADGKILKTFFENTNQARLDVSPFPSGIYFLRVTAADGTTTHQKLLHN